MSPDSGTFASRLPNDSGLQVDNSFGSSSASSGFRSNPLSNPQRNRFGDVEPSTSSRFAPISSRQGDTSKSIASTPPVQPASRGFAPSTVVPASAQQPFKSAFSKPASSSNGFSPAAPRKLFAQPGSSKPAAPATPTPPTRMPVSQPITRPIAKAATPRPTQPQANSQTIASPNSSPRISSQFPAQPKFAGSPSPSGLQPSSRLANSLGGSNSLGRSNSTGSSSLRPIGSSTLRSGSNGAGVTSARKMIPRETSSPSGALSSSSLPRQSNSGTSRLAPQTSNFASQSNQSSRQPLRGQPINNRNDLRNNSSVLNQQPPARNESSGKADRASINFAKQADSKHPAGFGRDSWDSRSLAGNVFGTFDR